MEIANWITIAFGVITLFNSWGQFLVKEVLLNKSVQSNDIWIEILTSKAALVNIGLTGIVGIVSIFLLVLEIMSFDSVTRISVFFISMLTVVSVLNVFLIQSMLNLRTIAQLRKDMEDDNQRAIATAMAIASIF